MCVQSAVMEEWWPKPCVPFNPLNPFGPMNPSFPSPGFPSFPTYPSEPVLQPVPTNAIPWTQIQQDPKLAEMMLEVLKQLEKIDKRMGLMEQCLVSESEKKKVKAKLRRIAKKTKKDSIPKVSE